MEAFDDTPLDDPMSIFTRIMRVLVGDTKSTEFFINILKHILLIVNSKSTRAALPHLVKVIHNGKTILLIFLFYFYFILFLIFLFYFIFKIFFKFIFLFFILYLFFYFFIFIFLII